ncbi:helix-turn-helix domain-containing protein [Psychroflexus tropicus]|uniref:helix-turn-helix domain-containing protein n=1 Tax=Psychroflexus tropicus TaxID=197345 RepID=UPI00035C61E0|nr:helix-turn-helix transcriptional regulator [Psychroflexus tropicus]
MKLLKLIKQRKNRGLSQECIAEKMNFTQSQYCRRENGLIQMTISEWEKLSLILDVNLNEIYESKFIKQQNGIPILIINSSLYNDVLILNRELKLLKKENQKLKKILRSKK